MYELCMYVYVCMHVYVCMYVCVYVCMYVCVCTYVALFGIRLIPNSVTNKVKFKWFRYKPGVAQRVGSVGTWELQLYAI